MRDSQPTHDRSTSSIQAHNPMSPEAARPARKPTRVPNARASRLIGKTSRTSSASLASPTMRRATNTPTNIAALALTEMTGRARNQGQGRCGSVATTGCVITGPL